MNARAQGQTWDPKSYETHAGFVPELGAPVLELLAPQPGEDILDLGCGDGVLTEKLAQTGARVVGVDSSAEQIEAARARGIDAYTIDGHDLAFDRAFDAVFSNAALHWMIKPDATIAGVARALRPGGRFVGEFGGAGNVDRIRRALRLMVAERGFNPVERDPWFFPTAEDYAARLREAGFSVLTCKLIDRPTPLPTDMAGWLSVMGQAFLQGFSEGEKAAAIAETVDRLRPELYAEENGWSADYVRLRFAARLAG